jgi:predicted RNA methylase
MNDQIITEQNQSQALIERLASMENRLRKLEGTKQQPTNYQGWTNYESWCVSLHLDHDVKQYKKTYRQAATLLKFNDGNKECATRDFAEWLEQETEKAVPSYLKGVFLDLVNGALDAVNWREIAAVWMSDLELPEVEAKSEPRPEPEPPATKPTKSKPLPADDLFAALEPTQQQPASKHMETATPEILDILSRSAIDDDGLTLPGEQLERKNYEAVNVFLDLAGAKWHKGKKRHLFQNAAAREKIKNLLETGELLNEKKHFQAYYTPASVAQELVGLAGVAEGMDVLEPSAGAGAIAFAAREAGGLVYCVEMNPEARRNLADHGLTAREGDFLSLDPAAMTPFHRVLMNPPFTNNQDIKHVQHAYQFLKPGGKLYAIMSPGFTMGGIAIREDFKRFVAEHGRIVKELPEGTFSESGTEVRTVIIELTKAG